MQPYQPPADPTAVAGRRVVAAIIDVGLGWLLYVVLFAVLARRAPAFTDVGRMTSVCDGHRLSCTAFGHYYVDGARRIVLQLVGLFYVLGVFVLMRGMTGRTLGTVAMGVVTVGEDGNPIGAGRALVRSVAGIVDWFPFCIPGLLGLILIVSTRGHRRIGDMAAKSFVVAKHQAGRPVVVAGLSSATAYVPAGPPVTPTGPPMAPTGPPTAPPGSPIVTAGAPGSPTASTGPPVVTSVVEAADAPPPDPTQPHWDPERKAYIQWDAVGQRWMRFDQDTQSWGPI